MIIVSITGPSLSQARRQMAVSGRYADLFELRLDLIADLRALTLVRNTRKPVIATCRRPGDGGSFRGDEDARARVLSGAAREGVTFLDIELNSASLICTFRRVFPRLKFILSHHHNGAEHRDARGIFERMMMFDADVLKFAYTACDSGDISIARDFLARAKLQKKKAIAVAMGEFGESSRVIYKKIGSWATYASAEEGEESAPGQIPAHVLRRLYRVHRINASTKVFGVTGNPLQQSKGIFLHNPLFRKYGVNAVYCRFPVVDIASFMDCYAPMLSGFSVTIPHKQSVMRFLDEMDGTAKAIGAVNTVLRRKGGWFGTNTDASGALDAIEQTGRVKGKTLLVLGAGGAARAIAYEAVQRGARVLITNRSEDKARRLAREFDLVFVPRENIRDVSFDILANTTSVGMAPDTGTSPIQKSFLRGTIVFDAVYNPPMTKLLRDARSVGATIVQGTEMYINQAALQFALYAGIKPSRTVMRRILGM